MKKLSAIGIAGALALSLTACGPSEEEILEEALWSCAEFMELEFIKRHGTAVPEYMIGDLMIGCLEYSERDLEAFLETFSD